MQDLKQGMRALANETDRIALDFRRALLDKAIAPKQLLLQLQQRLDHLRQSIWDTRKLCDPFLVPSRRDPQPSDGSLTERVVRFVDEQRSHDQPTRRRSG